MRAHARAGVDTSTTTLKVISLLQTGKSPAIVSLMKTINWEVKLYPLTRWAACFQTCNKPETYADNPTREKMLKVISLLQTGKAPAIVSLMKTTNWEVKLYPLTHWAACFQTCNKPETYADNPTREKTLKVISLLQTGKAPAIVSLMKTTNWEVKLYPLTRWAACFQTCNKPETYADNPTREKTLKVISLIQTGKSPAIVSLMKTTNWEVKLYPLTRWAACFQTCNKPETYADNPTREKTLKVISLLQTGKSPAIVSLMKTTNWEVKLYPLTRWAACFQTCNKPETYADNPAREKMLKVISLLQTGKSPAIVSLMKTTNW